MRACSFAYVYIHKGKSGCIRDSNIVQTAGLSLKFTVLDYARNRHANGVLYKGYGYITYKRIGLSLIKDMGVPFYKGCTYITYKRITYLSGFLSSLRSRKKSSQRLYRWIRFLSNPLRIGDSFIRVLFLK